MATKLEKRNRKKKMSAIKLQGFSILQKRGPKQSDSKFKRYKSTYTEKVSIKPPNPNLAKLRVEKKMLDFRYAELNMGGLGSIPL